MHTTATFNYFCAPEGHLWEWEPEEDSQALVWSGDMGHIVFRAELDELLEACVPSGLPPLGSLLMVIAAASDTYDAATMHDRLRKAADRATGGDGGTPTPTFLAGRWDLVGPGLDRIHALPKELRNSGPARWRLLQTLFEHTDLDPSVDVPPTRARDIVGEFRQTPFLGVFQRPTPQLNGLARLLNDLIALRRAFMRCPPETLQHRLDTGVDDLPTGQLEFDFPRPAEVPTLPPAKDLLHALEQEGGELAQVAGLARRLSAMLHVPHPVSRREELPLGGVSDITNRGEPSRLLMTELAWDDLTFAVRLAQGEALYLRRESPPAEPPPRRLLLIDTGIFLWGKPRLLALGAALALMRQRSRERNADITAYALEESGFEHITLETADSVREHLTRLQPAPHPGHALTRLAEGADSPFVPDTEVFLITHPDAQELIGPLPVWRRLACSVPLHTLLVDREGNIELSRHTSAGVLPLAHARVELEDLLPPTRAGLPTLGGHSSTPLTLESERLPHFYRKRPWPLCHTRPPAHGQSFWIESQGHVGISTTGCVCWWPLRSQVGLILYPVAPAPDLHGLILDGEDKQRILLLFRSTTLEDLHLLVTTLSGESEPLILSFRGNAREISDVRVQSQAVVLKESGILKAFSLRDGALLATSDPTGIAGSPWFDGEKFHPLGDIPFPPSGLLASSTASVKPTTKRHRINEVRMVGFGETGGLFLQKEQGRLYHLKVDAGGGLQWTVLTSAQASLRPLQPVIIDGWPDSGISQAVFPDGRRILLDPRGFLHVCDDAMRTRKGNFAREISVMMVKGATAAWDSLGFHYGDPSLLWNPNIVSVSVLLKYTATLFRSCTPTLPVRQA